MRDEGLDLKVKIDRYSKELYLLTLFPPIAGFGDFICVWLHRGDPNFIVDVGPSATAYDLVNALNRLDIRHLDYIFLTHIHIDHSGALGDIAAEFPHTPIVCHKSTFPHLSDTRRLWEGSLKTLGDTARAYGPIKPVSSERLIDSDTFESDYVQPIFTPGHAPHHVSYLTEKYLFAGEAGGVCLPLASGRFYLRPATPPRFYMENALESIDVLISKKPERLCYGHCGIRHNGLEMLVKHRAQLELWREVIKEEMGKGISERMVSGCMRRLLKEDRLLAGFSRMSSEKKARERFFFANSIKGFISYIENSTRNL